MSSRRVPVSRPMVGLIALVCIGVWAAMFLVRDELSEDARLWQSGFGRVGFVMAAFWLALPTRQREAAWANVSPWTFLGILLALFAVVRSPIVMVPVVIVVVLLGLLLRPRKKRRPPAREKQRTEQEPPSHRP